MCIDIYIAKYAYNKPHQTSSIDAPTPGVTLDSVRCKLWAATETLWYTDSSEPVGSDEGQGLSRGIDDGPMYAHA